ncbi:MAG TPA: SBBP repeat-containing protein [Ignavibacteria bacterium]|nr:SBBP repeat-containing protein [Ignavibacteria bacterium]HMQ98689.1 SBBP repeat-containing protein [Ignavibacteria bacterium]
MKKIILLSLIFVFSTQIYSQVSTVWEKRYNGTGNDYDEATSIYVDAAGNIYVAGASTGSGSGKDFTVVKYNSDGLTQWVGRYNGPGNADDDAYLVKVDNAGNVYVSGASTGSGTGLDYCVVKYNSAGVQQWASRYNGPGNATDEVYSLQFDNSGNVYITGYSNGGSTGDDICTIKYNSSGAQQWMVRYNGSANNDDYGNSISIDNAGNSYVTGAVTRTGSDLDYITLKYNTSGVQIWAVFYNGPGNGEDFPSSNAIDANGNIFVTGYSYGSTSGPDYCTIKYNNSGAQQWVQRYDGPDGWDESWNVILDPAGNVYITGNSAGIGTGDDYCTIKYNNSGVQQWIARYTGPDSSNDYCNWVAPDANGNVYVTGIVGDGAGSPQNIVTVGYNTAGVQQWVQTYNGIGNEFDSGNALTVDNQGNVYVTGGSDNLGNTDFVTIKYSSTIGIQPISTEIPNKFSLEQNYPNPFNPATKIRFSISSSNPVMISIFDVTGKHKEDLINSYLNAGVYEITFNSLAYSSGVYFYRVVFGNFSETRKMIIIK